MAQSQPREMPDPTPDQLHEETRRKIRLLQARAGRGLWYLAAFLLISIAASRGFDLLPALSQETRQWLGPAPPVRLIQIALVVYTFSGIVLILARMASGSQPGNALAHLGFLSGFFTFFHLASALQENFWAVLAAGGTILSLSAFHVWTQAMEQVRQEEELLARLERQRNLAGPQ